MKAQLLKVTNSPVNSFSVRQDLIPNINNRWHYHPEVELIYFHRGSGTEFIGDNIRPFSAGDVVLVGSNLPHYWKYDTDCYQTGDEDKPYSTVVHFYENFLGEQFLHLPESKPLRSILEKAKRGILINGKASAQIEKLTAKIYSSEGLDRILSLLQCLLAFANSANSAILSSIGFNYSYSDSENDRINAIYNYTLNNFDKKVFLEEIANIAGLVPNSFCRYFKLRTGKTYSQFLLEIRIGHACKLLLENKMSIKQVCFESGFNNFSCFHKNFRVITGKTPLNYQVEYMQEK